MSGRITVRYRREPIMLLYSLWSTASSFSFGSSAVAVLIGVDTSLSSAMLDNLRPGEAIRRTSGTLRREGRGD
jgi:hypothetical protein